MDILQKYYPNNDHIFVFDNATIHTKHPPGSLSARHMPKNIPKPKAKEPEKEANWLVELDATDEQGRPIYGPDRKKLKKQIRMTDGVLPNGQPQSLYFSEGHPQAGVFKGMAVTLMERGFFKEANLNAQCKDFKCPECHAPGVFHFSFSSTLFIKTTSHPLKHTQTIIKMNTFD